MYIDQGTDEIEGINQGENRNVALIGSHFVHSYQYIEYIVGLPPLHPERRHITTALHNKISERDR